MINNNLFHGLKDILTLYFNLLIIINNFNYLILMVIKERHLIYLIINQKFKKIK